MFARMDTHRCVKYPSAKRCQSQQAERSTIVKCIRRASIFKIISYATRRMPITELVSYIPEIAPLLPFIRKDSLCNWQSEMEHHNEVLRRGRSMALDPKINTRKYEFASLDSYILRMHSSKLVEVLDAFTSFAERLIPLIRKGRESPSWWLNEHLIVQRHHWQTVASHVLTLLNVLGFDEMHPKSSSTCWPDRETLERAASRTFRVYSAFGDGHEMMVDLTQFSPSSPSDVERGDPKRRRLESA